MTISDKLSLREYLRPHACRLCIVRTRRVCSCLQTHSSGIDSMCGSFFAPILSYRSYLQCFRVQRYYFLPTYARVHERIAYFCSILQVFILRSPEKSYQITRRHLPSRSWAALSLNTRYVAVPSNSRDGCTYSNNLGRYSWCIHSYVLYHLFRLHPISCVMFYWVAHHFNVHAVIVAQVENACAQSETTEIV